MKGLNYIQTERDNDTGTIWLNRPDKGNALHPGLIREFIDVMKEWNGDHAVRFILIRGRGKHFCAGADLNWMVESANLSEQQNKEESLQLAAFFESVFFSGKICISWVHGACYGGGVGLAAVSDFVFAEESARFSFGEIRLGLVPATIAPFVSSRTGTIQAKQLMLTGEALSASEARGTGLVDQVISPEKNGKQIEDLLEKLRTGSPHAQQSIKKLLNSLVNRNYDAEVRELTSDIIARARISEEGREGIRAFLEKRNPNWNAR